MINAWPTTSSISSIALIDGLEKPVPIGSSRLGSTDPASVRDSFYRQVDFFIFQGDSQTPWTYRPRSEP
ncbi:uncharacterized protein METZ01_LOCUS313914, partial [marine metagenome]